MEKKAIWMKAGKETGSLMNYLMSRKKTVPVVGRGATVLYWTDREAWEVMEVSQDMKTAVLKKYNPKRIDGLGMSDSQQYEYKEITDLTMTVVWKWNAWRNRTDVSGDDGKCKFEYPKVNIVWGVLDEHYDYSF
jgi:hypothetical protein